MRHDGWAQLDNDEEHGGLLIPMMMLHDDPEIGPQPSPSALPLKIFFDMRRVELRFRPVLMQPILPSFTHVYSVSVWQLRRVAV